MTEVPNPLVVMTGTAPRTESPGLFAQQRALALSGASVALYEWSAPPGADWRDEETWREASPRWTPSRLRHLRAEQSKPEPFFRSEYLCQPQAGSSDPWLDLAAWAAAREPLDVPQAPAVAAVEDARGGIAGSVALAWMYGGRAHVVGMLTESLEEAWEMASTADRMLCGITLRGEQQARAARAFFVGRRETSTALPELRRLAVTGQLAWDGDDLDEQARAAVVREDSTGSLRVGPQTPTGVLRASAWAVQALRATAAPVLV